MNEKKSLINLLLVSTAALSGYKQGAANQHRYDSRAGGSYRSENPTSTTTNVANSSSSNYSPSNQMPYTPPTTYSSDTNNATSTDNTTSTSYPMSNTTYSNNTNATSYTYSSPNTTQSTPASNSTTIASNTTSNTSYSPYCSNNCGTPNNTTTQTSYSTSPFTTINMTSPNPSATDAAQSDETFLPALVAALYAADEAVNLSPEATGPFELQPLEYNYDTLEPYISEDTLRIHHDSLHRNYVEQLNAALARYPEFYEYTLSELLLFHDRFPSDVQAQIIHNAGGNYNHALTWKVIGPATPNRPCGEFATAINEQFGSFENLIAVLTEAALSVRGTGYAWLTLNPYGRMIVVTTEEQLSPIPLRTVPLLPIDVWEHAHYLDYGENRDNYVDAYLDLVDWERVGARYTAANDIFMNVQ